MINENNVGEITLDQVVLDFVSTFTLKERTQWISNALNISRMSWSNIFKSWLANYAAVQNKSGTNFSAVTNSAAADGKSEVNKRKVYFIDPSSEILTKESSDVLTSWFPEWALGNYLECIFRASKHGYKYVKEGIN